MFRKHVDKLSTPIVDKSRGLSTGISLKKQMYRSDISVRYIHPFLWIKCGKLIHISVDKFLSRRVYIENNLSHCCIKREATEELSTLLRNYPHQWGKVPCFVKKFLYFHHHLCKY